MKKNNRSVEKQQVTKVLAAMVFFLLCWSGVRAQNYPIQANLSIAPPYSVYLQDYIAPGIDKLALNLMLTDLTAGDVQVKLKVTIEGQGVKLVTKANWFPEPITVSPGIPERFTGYDLSDYFNPDHLDFQGITRQKFVQTGALPQGVYRFCIEVREFNRNATISNPACVTAWLILSDPPLINMPANGEKLRATDPQNIVFQWTPRHTGSPNSAFTTEYEFKLVEIWPEGTPTIVGANDAILSSNSIYETTTQSTTLVYGIAETPLVPGRAYAFRVRAKSIVGVEEMDLFKNNGYSETVMFIYGDECKPPTSLEGDGVSSKRITASWEAAFNHTAFNLRYREANDRDAEWFTEETYVNDKTIDGLKSGTPYEFQVQAVCGSIVSEYTDIASASTDIEQPSEFACGAPAGTFSLDNTDPLDNLYKGDYIYANDFDIKIDSIAGSNGLFSGTGVAEMPFLSLVKVRVKFTGITVNTDYRMIDGAITTIYNPHSKVIVDLDGDDEVSEDGDTEAGTNDGSDTFAGTDVTIEGQIDSVYVEDNGDIVVVTTDGETEVITPETDEDTGETKDTRITDDAGNTVVVDGGNVSGDSGNDASTSGGDTEKDSVLIVQNELIKEVLKYFKDEINTYLENNGKGPLDVTLIRKILSLPDCLPKDEEKLETVLGKIEEYIEAPEILLNMVKEDSINKTRIEELTAKLIGKQPPYAAGLSDAEWDELLKMVCPYLLPKEEPIVIEGLSRNANLVAINTIDSSFKPDSDRLELTYTIMDTLNLEYTKLEFYHLGKEDTTMVTFYTDLEKGQTIEFADSQDDNKTGWSGKGSDGEFVEAGKYRVKLTAAIDESFSNGYEDYEQFEIEDPNKPKFPITTDQLEEIFPDTDDKERIKEVVDAINKYSNEFGITTKDKMAHFIAQIGTETAGLEKLTESSNYSAENIFKIFLKVKRTKNMGASKLTHKYCDLIDGYDCSDCSSCPNVKGYEGPALCSETPDYYFPTKDNAPDYKTWDETKDIETSYVKSSTLFDYVYSCRLGNGAKSTKDGSTYKGVGFVHLTGKGTYKEVSDAWNKEYPNDKKEFDGKDIELLKTNIDIAIKASLIYWKMKKINDMIDGNDNDLLEVTAKVNLGYYASYVKTTTVNGYDQRKKYYEACEKAF